MVGLVALITLIALVLQARQGGAGWLVALLAGVKRSLLGVLALYGLAVVLAMGLGVANALLRPVADTVLAFVPEGQPPASRASGLPATLPTRNPAASTTSLPTPTPRVLTSALPTATPPAAQTPAPAPRENAPSPASTPRPATPTPTPAPASDRAGCDPAYPDARTCIPPGPPWDQGCAITAERRFTVLPPDPQGLDHDKDGIGCEPIA